MKFQISSQEFAKVLTLVGKGISSRATLPVLSGVLLDVEDNKLTLIGSNTEIALKVETPVMGEEEGSFLVPARLLTDFVLNVSAATLTVESHETSLRIVAGKTRSDFAGLSVEEYPELSFVSGAVKYELPVKQVTEAIDRVGFAASGDEARAILTGVSLKVEKGILEMAATDGFRLSVEKFSSDVFTQNFGIVVPSKVMGETGKILRESSGNNAGIFNVGLSQDGNQLIFELPGNILFMSRVLEGTFPPYNKIIPTSYATRIIFTTDELFKAVRTGSLFARSGASVLKLSIDSSEGVVRLSSATEQVGEYSSEVSAKVEGSNNSIAFNSKYLLDFLGKVKSGEVILEMNGANQPGVWRVPEFADYLHVVMPVRTE